MSENKNTMQLIGRFLLLLSCIFIAPGAMASWSNNAANEIKVIGYIASFTDMRAAIDKTDLSKLTHINLSFTNPDAQGNFIDNEMMTCMPGRVSGNVSIADVRYVVDKAQAAGVKVLASVAGGVIPACSGNWETLLQPANRPALVDSLIALMETFNLDGIDIDIEGVLLTNIDNAGNYTPFIQALSTQLITRNKLLTCATASYVGGMIPVSSIPYFDFVNIMAYDAIGPSWGPAGAEHSTYAMAVDHINLWIDRGLTKEQLVLGVPFYGYGFGTYKTDYTYANILSEFGSSAVSSDVIGSACAGCNYITFNSTTTIKAKSRLALEHGSGIMIWELSQDAAGENSLLSIIDNEVKLSVSSSNNSSDFSSSSLAVSSASSSVLSSLFSSKNSSENTNNGQSSGGGSVNVGMILLMVFALILRQVRLLVVRSSSFVLVWYRKKVNVKFGRCFVFNNLRVIALPERCWVKLRSGDK